MTSIFRTIALELGRTLLKLAVDRERAANEPHRTETVTMTVERRVRSGQYGRLGGHAQVVVGTEVKHLAAADTHMSPLWGGNETFFLVQTGSNDAVQLAS